MDAETLRNLLDEGDMRTTGAVDVVVEHLLVQPKLSNLLIQLIRAGNKGIRMRGMDALEKFARREPASMQPVLAELLGPIALIEQQEVQWHIAQIFGIVPLRDRQRRRAILCLERFLASSESKIVFASSLEALHKLYLESDRDQDASNLIVAATSSPYPSVRARARKIIKISRTE